MNHLPDAEQPRAKRLAQLAACCLSFNSQMIYFLAQQLQLEPPSPRNIQVQVAPSCFDWLTEQTFVEPVSAGQRRVDDVARDVFRASLWQEDQAMFERIHDLLARYFKAISDKAVAPNTPTSEKYENPDWRKPRAEYLYHLLFTRQANLQTIWQSHLLEATYLRQGEVLQAPLQAVLAEHPLTNHPYLAYTTRSFLDKISPTVEYGRAVLEEDPIDYAYNETELGLSKSQIDTAIEACLSNSEDLEGVARFAALFYRSKRCLKAQKQNYLSQAKQQAKLLTQSETPKFLTLCLFQLGVLFYDSTLFKEAIACWDQTLAIKPDLPEVLINKGVVLAALGQKDEAIVCYDLALAIRSDYHKALLGKGNVLVSLGRNEEAIVAYDQAIKLKTDYPEALNGKGNVLSTLGRKKDAIVVYDQALKFKPDSYRALWGKGAALAALGFKEEAIACYDQALKIKPDSHQVIYNKGIALFALGKKEESIACYEKALELKPDLYIAQFKKGKALSALGRMEEAILAYEQMLSPEFFYTNACRRSLQGDIEGALEWLKDAIDLDPENLELAKTDADFAPIRHDERFRALVEGE